MGGCSCKQDRRGPALAGALVGQRLKHSTELGAKKGSRGTVRHEGEVHVREGAVGVLPWGRGAGEEVAGRQRGHGERGALHDGPASGWDWPAAGDSVPARLSGALQLALVKGQWVPGLISGIRDGEGSGKGFPMGAGEPCKAAEQGRVVNTVLMQQCAGGEGKALRPGSCGEC